MKTAFSISGCRAIITGASSGLGAEFARQMAGRAELLLLAARSREAMETLAAELKGKHPALKVEICVCDLAVDAGRAALWQAVDALPERTTLLINNAGLGDYGAFAEAPEARIRQQIDLNISALTLLTREYLGRVQPTAERPAAILQVSSLAGVIPMPEMAVYAATKSYVTSLTEALATELASKHIQVMAVCPGPTPTQFGKNAVRPDGKDIDRGGQDLLKIPAERVVAEALQCLEAGGTLVYPSKRVSLAAYLFRTMPRFLLRAGLRLRLQRSQGRA